MNQRKRRHGCILSNNKAAYNGHIAQKRPDVRFRNPYISEDNKTGGAATSTNKTSSIRVNVTLRRVRVTIGVVEKQYVLHFLSTCLQPCIPSVQSACAVLYCHVRPVWLYHVFPHYLTNGTILEGNKSYWTKNRAWIFLYNLCLKYFSFWKAFSEILSQTYTGPHITSVFLSLCMFRSVYSVSLCCSVYSLCVNMYWTTATGISGHFSTTLTEVFPCTFLSCKANTRV
jgi:hypothetical protein